MNNQILTKSHLYAWADVLLDKYRFKHNGYIYFHFYISIHTKPSGSRWFFLHADFSKENFFLSCVLMSVAYVITATNFYLRMVQSLDGYPPFEDTLPKQIEDK